MSDTTIRADALAGLIVGWTGPVDYLDYEAAENGETDEPEWSPAIVNALGMVWYEAEDCSWRPVYRERPELRLDCLRPEVQARVGRMLAAGVGCEACGGRGSVQASAQPGCDGECPEPCGCDAGWTRKPSPIHHILDAARTNALSNQHIAEAVAWSVRSVARGGEVLAGIRGEREPIAPLAETRPIITGRSITIVVSDWGWKCGNHRGPETGHEGRAKADAALLAANIAYIDSGALVLPTLPTNRSES